MGQDHEDLAALLPNLANQMRGLLSNLYLAASQAIPAEAREQDPALDAKAAVLDQSFYRLLRLVNSLSSAEYLAAAQPAALRDADLVKLIGEVCESAGDLAEMLGIHLKFICAMERRICAVHAGAMEQLLYHLLSNALKFTPAGGTVTVELKKSGGELLLSVADTGCGISPEQMEHLFDGYLHTQAVPRRGLGLGLPLCRAIAERHGGCIAVKSVPGQGSCFTVFLPDRQSYDASVTGFNGQDILVADTDLKENECREIVIRYQFDSLDGDCQLIYISPDLEEQVLSESASGSVAVQLQAGANYIGITGTDYSGAIQITVG